MSLKRLGRKYTVDYKTAYQSTLACPLFRSKESHYFPCRHGNFPQISLVDSLFFVRVLQIQNSILTLGACSLHKVVLRCLLVILCCQFLPVLCLNSFLSLKPLNSSSQMASKSLVSSSVNRIPFEARLLKRHAHIHLKGGSGTWHRRIINARKVYRPSLG